MNRYAETNVWNDGRSYRPDPYTNLAEIERIEKVALHLRRLARQAKWRGRFELAVMVAVAVAIGVMLAVGHS